MAKNTLREVKKSDLDEFFNHQQDDEANYIAAFTSKDPTNRKTFDLHWKKLFEDINIINKTITFPIIVY